MSKFNFDTMTDEAFALFDFLSQKVEFIELLVDEFIDNPSVDNEEFLLEQSETEMRYFQSMWVLPEEKYVLDEMHDRLCNAIARYECFLFYEMGAV